MSLPPASEILAFIQSPAGGDRALLQDALASVLLRKVCGRARLFAHDRFPYATPYERKSSYVQGR